MTVCARPPFFLYPASVSVTNDLKGVLPPECPAAYTQPTRSFRFAFSVANMSQVKIGEEKKRGKRCRISSAQAEKYRISF